MLGFWITLALESAEIVVLTWRSDLWPSTLRWQQIIKIRFIRAMGGETFGKENTGDNWKCQLPCRGKREFMNDFTKLEWKIIHVILTKIKTKLTINYINLVKSPSFPSGCHPALSPTAPLQVLSLFFLLFFKCCESFLSQEGWWEKERKLINHLPRGAIISWIYLLSAKWPNRGQVNLI